MSKGKRFLIFIIIFDIALLGVYGSLFYGIKVVSQEASALSYDLEEKRLNKDELSLLQRAINETQEEREKLNSYFVRSGDIDAFIEEIVSLGEESNTTITLNALMETPNNTLSVDLRGRGTFENLFYFMKLIEYAPYHIEFKKVYLNTGIPSVYSEDGEKKKQKMHEWDASFTLTLFGYIKE